jgi:tripartite-type tricarboxylate transporter receptor subunit TctC
MESRTTTKKTLESRTCGFAERGLYGERKAFVVLCSFIIGCLSFTFDLKAQSEPFYKGKTIRVIVAFSPGGGYDLWARLITRYMDRYIPGNPNFIVQNMPGAGSITAANFLHNIAKPDGLTLGSISAALYFDQLVGRQEVNFDWARFSWIGTPERTSEMIYIRSDTPFKTIEDIRKAAEPPRCGAVGTGSTDHYFPKLLEDALGVKFNIVTGYPGSIDIDLATEKGEVHCRAGTTSAFFGREPGRTWSKTGFVRLLVQGGKKRDARAPDTPTIYELMDKHGTADAIRRLASVLLSPGDFGRPILGPPGIPPERLKLLREAFTKTMSDPDVLAEAKKNGWETNFLSGEEMAGLAKEVVIQPPEVIDRMKKLLGK